MGGALEPALPPKHWEKEWPPDMLVLKMTFPVQFVDIFLVSQWSSPADTDSVKFVYKTAGAHNTRISTAVLCAGVVVQWIKLW